MNNAGKALIWIIVAIVLAGVIALSLVITNLDRIVKDMIETYGSEATGAAVDVGRVEISLGAGQATLGGLSVGNPEGFESDYALRFDSIDMVLDTGATTTETIVIERLTIDAARMIAEFRPTGQSNLGVISGNLERYSGRAPSDSPEAQEILLVIEEFRFAGGELRAVNKQLEVDRTVGIPAFTVTDIGRRGAGATVAQAGRSILQPILKRALEAARAEALRRGGDEIRDRVRDKVGDLLGDEDGDEDGNEGGN